MNTYTDFPNTPPFGYGFIYFLRSPSGKAYIGQTSVSISKRLYMHNKSNGCRFLYAAIKKYGLENFFVGEVGCYPLQDLNDMEVRFIKEFDTLAPSGYNLTTGGNANHKCSAEARRKMSEASKGKPKSEEARQRMRKPKSAEARQRMRKPKSPEARKRMAEARRGKPMSENTRAELLKANIGNKLSEETKRKIAATKLGNPHGVGIGKPMSAAARAGLLKFHIGNHLSAETKQKISAAKTGMKYKMTDKPRKKLSAETKMRMSKPKSAEHKRRMKEGWLLRRLRKQDALPFFPNADVLPKSS
jgi:group I intron endonuclease